MGGSSWSDDFYAEREASRKVEGRSAFAYHETVARADPADRKVHEKLDPKGVKFRESRDSLAHPESVPIGVILDVTGSMRDTPRQFQAELPQLNAKIKTIGGIEHAQILFGAQGDTTCDRGSCQYGQFESGIEMDEDLGRFWLEGKGGGSPEESYQNAIYFFARHTVSDAWEKRQKKGYLFLTGDELAYPTVRAREMSSIFGDSPQGEDIPLEAIVKECQERYHLFFIIPVGTSGGSSIFVRKFWQTLLGMEYVILLQDTNKICETIALAIGLCEGNANLDQTGVDPTVVSSLRDLGKSLGRAGTAKTVRL